jgi:hypothetical protein
MILAINCKDKRYRYGASGHRVLALTFVNTLLEKASRMSARRELDVAVP